MDYKIEDQKHVIVMDKNELILMIALLHTGLDCMRNSPANKDQSQRSKLEGCELLVTEINRKILSY